MCYLIKVGCSVASQGEGRRHVVGCLENEFQTLKKSKLNKILFFIVCHIQRKHTAFSFGLREGPGYFCIFLQ